MWPVATNWTDQTGGPLSVGSGRKPGSTIDLFCDSGKIISGSSVFLSMKQDFYLYSIKNTPGRPNEDENCYYFKKVCEFLGNPGGGRR